MTLVPVLLVATAAIFAAVGWTAAFGVQTVLGGRDKRVRIVRSVMAGLLAGFGAWSAQSWTFLAAPHIHLLAANPASAAAAAIIAVLIIGSAFAVAEWRPSHWVSGAVLAGGGAAASLMTSLHALGVDPSGVDMRRQSAWVLAYGLLVSGSFALWQTRRLQGRSPVIGCGIGLILAVCAYASVGNLPAVAHVAPAFDPLGHRELALVALFALSLIVLGASAVVFVHRVGQVAALATFQRAIDALPSGLAIFDARGQLSGFNTAYADAFSSLPTALERGMPRQSLLRAVEAAGWLSDPQNYDAAQALGAGVTPGGVEVSLPDGRRLTAKTVAMEDGGRAVILNAIPVAASRVVSLAAVPESLSAANALDPQDAWPQPAVARADQTADGATSQATPALRVLVVDSDPVNRKMLSLLLEATGHVCVVAHSARDAVERASAERFSAVLVDLEVGSTSGLDAIREIRAAETASGSDRASIFSLSASGAGRPWDDAIAAGADAHLSKPIVGSQLAAALAAQAERRAHGSSDTTEGRAPRWAANF